MNSLTVDITELLASNGYGVIGTDLFGMEWGSPDKQVLVLERESFQAPLKDTYEQLAFQILVRGAKTDGGVDTFTLAQKIHEFLISQLEVVSINSVDYLGFEPMNPPYPIGRDDNDRFIHSANYYTYRDSLP